MVTKELIKKQDILTVGDSSMGLVMDLYAMSIISFCFHHVVDVSALSICNVLRTFVVVLCRCFLYVSSGIL